MTYVHCNINLATLHTFYCKSVKFWLAGFTGFAGVQDKSEKQDLHTNISSHSRSPRLILKQPFVTFYLKLLREDTYCSYKIIRIRDIPLLPRPNLPKLSSKSYVRSKSVIQI
jgi:hypothetical protein